MSLFPFVVLAAAAATARRRVRLRPGVEYRYTVEWERVSDAEFETVLKAYSKGVRVVSRRGTSAVVQFDHVDDAASEWELPDRWMSASGIFLRGDTEARFRLADVRAPEV